MRQLHRLWIQRYLVIHARVSDETAVDELYALTDEINEAMLSNDYSLLVSEENIAPMIDVNNSQVLQMKGQLFNFYSLIDGCDSCDKMKEC